GGLRPDAERSPIGRDGRALYWRALDAGACAWVTGDAVYGKDRKQRLLLKAREQLFVLAVASMAGRRVVSRLRFPPNFVPQGLT
ncbi:MAG: hypothetical protein J7D61_17210, partial [Marichromatium sp.]|nr:hypothetical protein [Marichromatium sp.]